MTQLDKHMIDAHARDKASRALDSVSRDRGVPENASAQMVDIGRTRDVVYVFFLDRYVPERRDEMAPRIDLAASGRFSLV